MAPRKVGKMISDASSLQNVMCTRKNTKRFVEDAGKDVKRKADVSPAKNVTKRSAFGDLTNADLHKKSTLSIKDGKNIKSFVQQEKTKQSLHKGATSKTTVLARKVSTKIPVVKVSPLKQSKGTAQATSKPTEVEEKEEVKNIVSEDSAESFYVSAEEEPITTADIKEETNKPPVGVEDFDAENINDPFQVSEYVSDIFCYLKSREEKFKIEAYMGRQTQITADMRELLVDWMVEMQESFELNHETLYLAVKLVDKYLSKVILPKETLQLVGVTALFLACKYDERIPPHIEDFLYVCDNVYKQHELLSMEVKILKVVEFELGIPLSYRFLRRYARCARVKMPTLTLARYILELSLMDYSFLTLSDSKLAAAALVLALMMEGQTYWNDTLEYYTGFKLDEIKDFVVKLNNMLQNKPKKVTTITNKYSHEIFFQVAKQPVLQKIVW